MSATVTVRGAGGAIFEMDVPTAGRALAQWNEQLAKGDITIIEKPVTGKPAVDKPATTPKATRSSKKEPATDAEE